MEEWRPVVGYEGIYSVSSDGRVRRDATDAIKRLGHTGHGYYNVSLSRDGVQRSRMVHRLVLEAFVGPRPDGFECRHLDGDGFNNSLTNLAWGTKVENQRDRIRHGTHSRGRRHPMVKLTEQQAVDAFTSDEPSPTCAKRLGVSTSTVQCIRLGRLWAHATAGLQRSPKKRPGRPKLDPEAVRCIRSSAESNAVLAIRYGVDRSIISEVRGGKRWTDV
ncbi:MAG: HNH endonuclease [Deltaproteobacteria bacterium]|nr:HNH endonuclease [Deltaproteobacteria bacterium]